MKNWMSLLWVIGVASALALAACTQPAQPTPLPTKPAAPPSEPTKPAPVPTKPAAPPSEPTKPAPVPTKPAASEAAKPTAPPAAKPTSAPAAQVKPLSPPVKVKYGSIGTLGGIAGFIADARGYFKDEGLDVEYINFRTGPDMIAPLSQGQLELGSGSINAGFFNAVARDIAMRMVAEPSNVERTMSLVVRTELASQIKDYADLKGRKIAIPSRADSTEIALEAALKRGGLTLEDVDVQILGFPDMVTAFANKAIDVAQMTEPTTTQGIQNGILVRWKLSQEYRTGYQVGAIMYSSKFAKENTEVARRLMVAHVRAARDYYEALKTGKGMDEIAAIAQKYSTVKDPKAYQGMYWPEINPDMTVKTQGVREDLDWYVKKGYVKQAPPLEDVIDNSFTDYALQRLGKYNR